MKPFAMGKKPVAERAISKTSNAARNFLLCNYAVLVNGVCLKIVYTACDELSEYTRPVQKRDHFDKLSIVSGKKVMKNSNYRMCHCPKGRQF